MAQVSYEIPSWSFKTFKARRHYVCRNCGGTIPSGTKYLRHVERLGPIKGKDPLRNVHVHLDCTAPWHQPEATHRLPHLGQLPARTPPTEVYDGTRYYHKPSIALTSKTLGTLLWQPPRKLAEKLAFTPKQHIALGAMVEIESTLTIVMTALMQASGSKRKAMKLNHLVEQITHLLEPVAAKSESS